MQTREQEFAIEGKRIELRNDQGDEMAHGYVYFLVNDDHDEPLAYIEGVWVAEDASPGYGDALIRRLERAAQGEGCYKINLTSRDARPDVHRWYKRLGYQQHGQAFRKDLPVSHSGV
jgi:ribosomal protein S18 acetylase RimI-like enzyme